MSTDMLHTMDEQADQVIARWSLAALGANLLPPPFDMMAVGTVFASMGGHLAKIYDVRITAAVLRDLGVAIANGIGAVLAGYVAFDLVKLIPGVSIWIAVFVQPPLVGAVAFAAGHAFKQYYHAVITQGRELSPSEISELAKKALNEKLAVLRESGYRFRSPTEVETTPRPPVETRPYAERQLIALVNKSVAKNYVAGQLIELGSNLSPIRIVTQDEVANVVFQPGHPRHSILYTGHPLKSTLYYPAAEFHRRVFEHKVAEVSRMLSVVPPKSWTPGIINKPSWRKGCPDAKASHIYTRVQSPGDT